MFAGPVSFPPDIKLRTASILPAPLLLSVMLAIAVAVLMLIAGSEELVIIA